MPRKQNVQPSIDPQSRLPTQNRHTQKKDEWAGFVPCELTHDDREAFDIWFGGDNERVQRELDDCLGVGLKLTLTYDGANQCYIASFSGRPDIRGQIAFTAILSGRGGYMLEALAVLCYKHTMVLNSEWWDALNAPKFNKRTFG